MSTVIPQFSYRAKNALRAMESRDERIETILFLLQTSTASSSSDAAGGDANRIRYADVRAAQLMLELKVHAVF
jgi:hypothetical protein